MKFWKDFFFTSKFLKRFHKTLIFFNFIFCYNWRAAIVGRSGVSYPHAHEIERVQQYPFFHAMCPENLLIWCPEWRVSHSIVMGQSDVVPSTWLFWVPSFLLSPRSESSEWVFSIIPQHTVHNISHVSRLYRTCNEYAHTILNSPWTKFPHRV